MLHHQPQILSPLPEMNSQAADQSSFRARKTSAAGNRSWSEEEETYLLQTRMQKMPYKHIAAHLKKTELACRLHFHQLSHGSHRRRRSSSVSSITSCSSSGQSRPYSMTPEPETYSQSSSHTSPMGYNSGAQPLSLSFSASPGRAQHKILLPKPLSHSHNASPEPFSGLRISTEVPHHPKQVDTERLRSIYEARRNQFWATIAADYGADVSPAQLEEIWCNGSNDARPLTPGASPDPSVGPSPVPKPSSFSDYNGSNYGEPTRHYNHADRTSISAISGRERQSYILPMPVPSIGRQRSSTWSSAPRDNMPIASLLNDE